MITKKQAKKCETHHHACDCREYKYQEMEQALKVIDIWAQNDALDNKNVIEMCDKALDDAK